MESKGRRTEIQIETHEVKVIRLRETQVLALCGRPGDIAAKLTPEETAEVLEIIRLIRLRKEIVAQTSQLVR